MDQRTALNVDTATASVQRHWLPVSDKPQPYRSSGLYTRRFVADLASRLNVVPEEMRGFLQAAHGIPEIEFTDVDGIPLCEEIDVQFAEYDFSDDQSDIARDIVYSLMGAGFALFFRGDMENFISVGLMDFAAKVAKRLRPTAKRQGRARQ